MNWHVFHLLVLVGIVSSLAGPLTTQLEARELESPQTFLGSNAKVLFLGDSNTNAGTYINMLEAHFLQEERTLTGIEWINLGLSSETCTGLTEPPHPFPRPNVHERLDRALEMVKPDVIVACYGMNDGIYHPFDQGRFEAYQRGLSTLVTKAKATGAFVVLMTPPPFDPLPMREQGKLVPTTAKEFSWTKISEDYDDVIERYATWTSTSLKDKVDLLIDIHTPMAEALAQRRKQDPHFAMSNDGVHFDTAGHRLLANIILKEWGKTPVPLDEGIYQQVVQRHAVMHPAWLSHVGHKRPGVKAGLPLSEAQSKVAGMQGVIQTLAKNRLQEDRFERLERKLAALAEDIRTAKLRFERYEMFSRFPIEENPVPLHHRKDLSGWEGDPKFWSVDAEGNILGRNEGEVPSSTYLFTKDTYREFRLIFEVKQTVSPAHSTMHSAVAVLGERFEDKGPNPYGFKGPLLMFCHDWGIWDAYRRNRICPEGHKGTLEVGDELKGDWNVVEFLVVGDRIRGAVNGTPVFDFSDNPEMLQASQIGLQLHSNKAPQEYRFRNLYIVDDLTHTPNDELISTAWFGEGEAP